MPLGLQKQTICTFQPVIYDLKRDIAYLFLSQHGNDQLQYRFAVFFSCSESVRKCPYKISLENLEGLLKYASYKSVFIERHHYCNFFTGTSSMYPRSPIGSSCILGFISSHSYPINSGSYFFSAFQISSIASS